MFQCPAAENGFLPDHAALLQSSYRHWTGADLISGPESARRLFEAPFAVVSHGTEDDPVFNYGNGMALALFALAWDAFCRLPSRRSAEPLARDERLRLLERVSRHGHIADYRGVRVSSDGRRFLIEDALVWNLIDGDGGYRGQAAAFHRWTFL